MVFKDRRQAGTLLGAKLTPYKGTDAVVVGLVRGGVVVAKTVADALSLPLDVLVVKKIPSPGNPEFAVGALAPDGVRVVHWPTLQRAGADEDYLNTLVAGLSNQIKQRLLVYRKGRKPLDVRGKTILIVDDGAATGATMEAAVKWLRRSKARKIVVGLPVAPPETVSHIAPEVDECVVLEIPHDMGAVGQFYKLFPQVDDGEVVQLLKK